MQDLMQREQIPAEDKALRYIAKAADGSMRDALSLLDQCIAFNLGETLTYDKALEVLGAVDTEVYSRLFRQMIAGDAVGCVEIVSEILIDGRDLTQFVNEYVWYLRGLMMLSASDQGEDMLDVSTERLAQMKEEATLADTETLIRYIRILSDLSGNLRFASQKRVLTEVAMIKLCKPQMDTEQDITTLKDRIANIEAQLEKGIVAAPQQTQSVPETVQAADEKTASTPKIMPKAIGEDVKAVLGRWRDVSAMCDPVMRNMLDQCRPTEAISAQCSKKFIIKVYSLPYKVVFQIIILGNFPVLTRCDSCSFFEYLHKAYLISVSAEVGYFLNGHIGGRKIILSCLDLCG